MKQRKYYNGKQTEKISKEKKNTTQQKKQQKKKKENNKGKTKGDADREGKPAGRTRHLPTYTSGERRPLR